MSVGDLVLDFGREIVQRSLRVLSLSVRGLFSFHDNRQKLVKQVSMCSHIGFWLAATRCSENGRHGKYREKSARSRNVRPPIDMAVWQYEIGHFCQDRWGRRYLKQSHGSLPAWKFGNLKAFGVLRPRVLIPESKLNREKSSEQCLTMFNGTLKLFLCRVVPVHETWTHLYTAATKEKS